MTHGTVKNATARSDDFSTREEVINRSELHSASAFRNGMRLAILRKIGTRIEVVPMSFDRWLTHDEAADLLGIQPGSLRNRARKEGWETGKDSQGRPTVLVPAAATTNAHKGRPREATKPDRVEASPDLAQLLSRVDELERNKASLRQERDQARADLQLERERADIERGRAIVLEREKEALRKEKDDRISLVESLVTWHRKSWFHKLFVNAPTVWLPGDL